MMFTAALPLTAPQTTGHPAALPQELGRPTGDTRIAASQPGGAAGSARSDHSSGDSPRHNARNREQASAPPTILQLKINTLLEEQQQRAQETAAEHAAPDSAPAAAHDTAQAPGGRDGPAPHGAAPHAVEPPSTTPPGPEDSAPAPSPASTLYAAAAGPEAPEPGLSKAI